MRQGTRVCYLQKLGLNGGTFCELFGCLFVGAVECCQTAVDPLVDLGVLDACGLHKGAYLADCCEQIGLGTRELDLDVVVGGHAAVLTHVVDKALDGLKLLGESCIIVSIQRDECVRYREGGMSAGDKALDDIHSFGNG